MFESLFTQVSKYEQTYIIKAASLILEYSPTHFSLIVTKASAICGNIEVN